MSESKFNVGDRVRNKRCGWVGVIEREFGKYPEVRYDEDPLEVYTTNENNLEFEDPKTAFLNDFSALLRKHDVSLIAHKTDMPVSMYFNNSKDDMPFAKIGKEINKGCGVVITADCVLSHDE